MGTRGHGDTGTRGHAIVSRHILHVLDELEEF